uniref:Protein amnionless n=1 Tax=Athene cunicularia TaxID=194338 RepID=A0A663M1A9_ATHCN
FLVLGAVAAVYKQWIPNTNFETASNWDKGRVPCASNVVHFQKNEYLPLNGEFVLASGAGFAAFDGSWDPGATVRFTDAEHHAWFNPTLWQAVTPSGELEPSGRIFSVDEERVPCHYDDVIFQPETSFRVNVDSSRRVIHLRSISLMGSPEAWAEYLRGPFAPLQFHGNGTLQVTGTSCPDKSGCACGNTPDLPRICAALLEASGRQCPAPACQSPLQPLGHCCGVCGEWGGTGLFLLPAMPAAPTPFLYPLKPLENFIFQQMLICIFSKENIRLNDCSAVVWGAQVSSPLHLPFKARVALLNRILAVPKQVHTEYVQVHTEFPSGICGRKLSRESFSLEYGRNQRPFIKTSQ